MKYFIKEIKVDHKLNEFRFYKVDIQTRDHTYIFLGDKVFPSPFVSLCTIIKAAL